jgi:glycosyltransferase involved in cell wall biosynthesis
MNYWLLTTEYPPFFGGGISTYCAVTVKMLSDKGHHVTVFVNDASVLRTEKQTAANLTIVRFNPSIVDSAFLGHVTHISYAFAEVVRQAIEEMGEPDVIEAQEYLGIAYYLLQFKYLQYDWCRNIPVLVTMHSPSFLYMEYNHVTQYSYPNYWICEMERFCLQSADLLIAPSQFILDEVHKRFDLRNNNVHVVPNPFISLPELATLSKNPVDEIIFFGKLTVQKGAFHLLRYFSKLWDNGFSEALVLIGGQDIVYHAEGRTMGDIIREKYKHYLEKGLLRMEGRIPPAAVASRLSSAKVVIVPSANDNLPYVTFEMMALGKILLISQQGGHAEVIKDGVEGFIFSHLEPDTFEKKLRLALSLNDDERRVISGNARKKAETYHPVHVYPRKMRLVSNLLEGSRPQCATFPFVRPLLAKSLPCKRTYTKKLSVVVPFYNLGQFISQTITSLDAISQSETEIIIVNDGSTDPASVLSLQRYRGRDDVLVIDTENRGLAHARNLGAQAAQGKYVAFLDADDLVSPDYYDKAMRVLDHYENVAFVGCWTQFFDESRKVWPTFSPEPPLILYHNLVNSSALVMRRQAFLEAGLNDPEMPFTGLEDYQSVISLIEAGFAGVVLPELLFHYRVRRNSMIRSISSRKKLFLMEYISARHKSIYNKFASEIFSLQAANGAGIKIDNPSLDYHLSNYLPFSSQLSGRIISLIKKSKTVKAIAYKIFKIIKK